MSILRKYLVFKFMWQYETKHYVVSTHITVFVIAFVTPENSPMRFADFR